MMGSMGFGNLKETIKSIDNYTADFQIVTICGNNKRAKKAIDHEIWKKRVYNLGFVTNVDEYMDAADLMITKPGGLTTSEALAKKLPLILMNPIPGQEDRNMQFLVNTGAAMMVTETFHMENALYQFFDCPWRRESMLNSVQYISKPNAAEDLYQFIQTLFAPSPQKEEIRDYNLMV